MPQKSVTLTVIFHYLNSPHGFGPDLVGSVADTSLSEYAVEICVVVLALRHYIHNGRLLFLLVANNLKLDESGIILRAVSTF